MPPRKREYGEFRTAAHAARFRELMERAFSTGLSTAEIREMMRLYREAGGTMEGWHPDVRRTLRRMGV